MAETIKSGELPSTANKLSLIAQEKLTPKQIQDFAVYLKTMDSISAKNQLDKMNNLLKESLEIEETPDEIQKNFSNILEKWKGEQEVGKTMQEVGKTMQEVEESEKKIGQLDQKVEQNGQVVGQVEQKVGQEGQKVGQEGQRITSECIKAASIIDERIKALSGGKSAKDLIPNYAAEVQQTKDTLVLQGKDPKLAESIVLLSKESEIIRIIDAERVQSNKPRLTQDDYKSLEQSFSSLRLIADREGLSSYAPKRTPTDIALANPTVTLEAYTKIKAGFEPPSTLVYINPKTGEIISPSALLTGERTIMTTSGERFREKDGLRILSPVPNVSEVDTILQNLTLSRQELEQRTRTTGVMSRVTQGEIAEKFPVGQFPKLKLPELKTEDPEALQKQLTEFFESPGYRELWQNPEHQLARENLEQRLKQLYQSVTTQAQLTKNIKTLETKKPEDIIRSRIAEQDQVIDSNLTRLSKLGMGSLGQEKYEKVVATINKKLKAQSSPTINDEASITEGQGDLLRQALLKLTGLDASVMYPDGTISTSAMQKLNSVNISTIENQLLDTTEATK